MAVRINKKRRINCSSSASRLCFSCVMLSTLCCCGFIYTLCVTDVTVNWSAVNYAKCWLIRAAVRPRANENTQLDPPHFHILKRTASDGSSQPEKNGLLHQKCSEASQQTGEVCREEQRRSSGTIHRHKEINRFKIAWAARQCKQREKCLESCEVRIMTHSVPTLTSCFCQ